MVVEGFARLVQETDRISKIQKHFTDLFPVFQLEVLEQRMQPLIEEFNIRSGRDADDEYRPE